jgi:hypothetical protein
MELVSDPDVFLPSVWPYAEAPLLTRPSPRPDFDCNNNGIDDAFDIAGFVPRGPYAVGDRPNHLAAGDFDGDGDMDLVVANRDDGTVTILWQRSFRRFDSSTTISVNTRPEVPHLRPTPGCLDAGDVGGGGGVDIFIGLQDTYGFAVLLRNDGGGRFTTEELWLDDSPWSPSPKCLTLADIDDDGHVDLLTTSGLRGGPTLTERVTLFRNRGDGSFAAPEHRETTLDNIGAITTADLDGDGYPEILFGAGTGRDVNIGLIENSTTDGTAFADWPHSWRDLPGISRADALVAADVFDDAGVNLAVLKSDGLLNVLPNLGGNLVVPEDLFDYSVGAGGLSIGAGDIDGDDRPDVIAPATATNTVALLRNFYRRSLRPAVQLPVSEEPVAVWVGNLDDDERTEIAVSHSGTDDVWILHQRPAPVSEDCDHNERPDSCDIRDNPGLDTDRDGVIDSCSSMLPAGRTLPDLPEP